MATVPIKESGDTFSHQDANVPFAIESATVDGSGNLVIGIGNGRMVWGDTIFELSSGAGTTDVTVAGVAASASTYYVVLDYAGGTPTVSASTSAPTSAHAHLLGTVLTDATPVVTTITDLRNQVPAEGGMIVRGGTAALPAFAFDSDPDTGMYRFAANDLAFATGGAVRLRVGSSGIIVDGNDLQMVGGGQIKAEDGDANGPGYTFDSDHNAGMFLQSGYLRFCLNGLQMLAMSPSQAVMYQYLDVQDNIKCDGIQLDQDGSRVNPAIKFNDPDTGWYHSVSLNRIICTVDLGGQSAYVGSTITAQTAFVPGRDNVMELGNNTFRWEEIWATDSTINTSDVRTKNSVEDSDLGLDFVRAIRPVTFVRNGRTRPHEGFVAQEVKAAMDGLGVEDFAGYIDPEFDPPDPEKWPEVYNEDGSFKADRMSKGLRYGEFIGPLAKAVQELADRLETLENA